MESVRRRRRGSGCRPRMDRPGERRLHGELMAVNVATITATGNDYIDGVSSTAAWGDSVPLDISYSYPAAASNYGAPGSYSPDNEPDSGFAVFNGTQQAFHDAQLLRLSTYYVPITFTKITESDSTH